MSRRFPVRSLASVCGLLALSVAACAGPDFFSQKKKAETPPAWQGVLVAEVHLPEPGAPAVEALSRLLEQGRSTPDVQEIAVTDFLPAAPADSRELHDISTEGNARPLVVVTQTISGEYFKLMRIPLSKGRAFGTSDPPGGIPVIILSEALAQEGWRGQEPLGRRVRTAPSSGWLTAVGVAQDAPRSLGIPEMYVPYTQSPGATSWFVLIRTAAEPASVASRLRQTLSSSNPGLVLGDLRSLEEI
jgi:hypothetical protein